MAGLFVFKDKSYVLDVPTDGEFVRWLQGKGVSFEELALHNAHEYGLKSVWDELPKLKTRPFNRIESRNGKLYKIPVDKQGKVGCEGRHGTRSLRTSSLRTFLRFIRLIRFVWKKLMERIYI